MSKKNYEQYTSQGANLQQAHTEYAEYHESNHQSFFNMNNAMGLFKILIIAGIILNFTRKDLGKYFKNE